MAPGLGGGQGGRADCGGSVPVEGGEPGRPRDAVLYGGRTNPDNDQRRGAGRGNRGQRAGDGNADGSRTSGGSPGDLRAGPGRDVAERELALSWRGWALVRRSVSNAARLRSADMAADRRAVEADA